MQMDDFLPTVITYYVTPDESAREEGAMDLDHAF